MKIELSGHEMFLGLIGAQVVIVLAVFAGMWWQAEQDKKLWPTATPQIHPSPKKSNDDSNKPTVNETSQLLNSLGANSLGDRRQLQDQTQTLSSASFKRWSVSRCCEPRRLYDSSRKPWPSLWVWERPYLLRTLSCLPREDLWETSVQTIGLDRPAWTTYSRLSSDRITDPHLLLDRMNPWRFARCCPTSPFWEGYALSPSGPCSDFCNPRPWGSPSRWTSKDGIWTVDPPSPWGLTDPIQKALLPLDETPRLGGLQASRLDAHSLHHRGSPPVTRTLTAPRVPGKSRMKTCATGCVKSLRHFSTTFAELWSSTKRLIQMKWRPFSLMSNEVISSPSTKVLLQRLQSFYDTLLTITSGSNGRSKFANRETETDPYGDLLPPPKDTMIPQTVLSSRP